MNIEVFNIAAIEDGCYRIAFRVSGAVTSYVVRVTEEPVPGFSGPHSLWDLLGGSKEATRKLAGALLEVHRTGSTDLPMPLILEENGSTSNQSSVGFWAASSAWNLSEESIMWASKHLVTRGNNGLFPIPFEHRVILERLNDFTEKVQNINICEHTMRGFRQLLVPKSSAGVRPATQLDPLDAIILTGIIYEVGEFVERARIPISEGMVFSFRFDPGMDGSLWDSNISYDAFQDRTREWLLEEDVSVVAETDISSFYHSVSAELVALQLERFGVRRKYASALTTLLKSLSIDGLPVGPSSSALLAEAVLTPIDLQLISMGARFVRFNDDYRFFCRSDSEAQTLLQGFADALWRTAGLTMQEAKTKISSSEDYQKKLEETWLTQLYTEDEVGNRDSSRNLIESARSVLSQAIDDSHVAWVRLCRESFKALPLEEKKAVLPVLLEEIARVWAVAPQVCRSLEALLAASDGGREMLEMVSHRLSSRSSNIPDYAVSWILHAFWRKEWKGKEKLASLDADLVASQAAARRELLIALRHTGVAGSVAYDQTDAWQHRAHVWATGEFDNIPLLFERSEQRIEWERALYEALASSDADDDEA